MDTIPRLVHADEAAKRFGVSRPTLRRYVREGLLSPPMVIGRSPAWPEDELLIFLAKLPRWLPRGRGRPKGVKNGEGGRQVII